MAATLANGAPGPSLNQFRHYIYGFMLQALVYGINVVLFLMCIWVLGIHIFKALHCHRFHKLHLFQNYVLLLFVIGMFAFSSLILGHQGIIAGNAWAGFLEGHGGNTTDFLSKLFQDWFSLQTACNVVFRLINWGTVGIILWRCTIYWKVQSIFPSEVMALPYFVFASCVVTGLLSVIQESSPRSLSSAVRNRNWELISWSISTALYYLLSLLVVIRLVYHRRVLKKQVGDDKVAQFASYLTIFNESGALVLVFATIRLIVLARSPDLLYLFQTPTAQIQVTLSLILVQRVTVGKAWSGKIIDCILHQDQKQPEETHKHEEVSTMGFNPNTELSSTQNDYASERTNKEHDLTVELRQVMGDKV
ncbi:hypothetical protein P691DRAFT_723139 [Macrolepiota fuliginosa MF-IS2]|uniref:Uncharacterized protein n=1 Tax=Macrolepiota fuliginosa MF-IS2 TaxID=1400762 RepID=A0A9P6C7H6_9AGAR|nr:hypothetical protein P691DRAFT_723139 [Macrolepiota fuliginosa MF-IS2]